MMPSKAAKIDTYLIGIHPLKYMPNSNIVTQDIASLLDGWIEAEQNGVQFPVPFDLYPQEGFDVAMLALTKLKEAASNAFRSHDEYLLMSISSKIRAIGKWQASFAMATMDHHNILSHYIDAVEVFIFHWAETMKRDKARKKIEDNGVVYFLLNIDSHTVKIGWSRDHFARLGTLERSSGSDTHVLGVIKASSQKKESEFHRNFSQYRIKGEWFKVEEHLERFLYKKFPVKKQVLDRSKAVKGRVLATIGGMD